MTGIGRIGKGVGKALSVGSQRGSGLCDIILIRDPDGDNYVLK